MWSSCDGACDGVFLVLSVVVFVMLSVVVFVMLSVAVFLVVLNVVEWIFYGGVGICVVSIGGLFCAGIVEYVSDGCVGVFVVVCWW